MTTPLNTEYNRIAGIHAGKGMIAIDHIRSGIVYFKWQQENGDTICARCEQGFFERNFRSAAHLEESKEPITTEQKKIYADYPYGLKSKPSNPVHASREDQL